MPLSPITRAAVVIFSELGFAVSLRFVIFFYRFLLGNSRRRIADICAFNVTESKQIQTCLISLDVNPSSGKMATSKRITPIGLISAHIIER